MSRHDCTKLVPPKREPENQVLETLEEPNPPKQKEEPELTELDTEIQCPRCNDIMTSIPTSMNYYTPARGCSFLLRCV